MARPKYLLIADDLRGKIKAGAYPVDSKLPAVRELAIAHGTAHNTVRSALGLLAREGLVESFQGDGIYVRKLPEAPAEPEDVKATLARVEGNLMDLYGKLGYEYPHEGTEPGSEAVAHERRA